MKLNIFVNGKPREYSTENLKKQDFKMFTIFKLKLTNIDIKIIVNIPAFFLHSWYYQQPENYASFIILF